MGNKPLVFLLIISISTFAFGQVEESSTRKFIDQAKFTQINKDWSTTATFKSGIGEYVKFFPLEVIDLKTNETIQALELNMEIKKPNVLKTAWVGLDEIEEFIQFIEEHIIPNLDLELDNQSSEYIFKAKEMTLSFLKYEKKNKLSIILNSYDDEVIPNYFFWTETQVSKIPELLLVLKKIK